MYTQHQSSAAPVQCSIRLGKMHSPLSCFKVQSCRAQQADSSLAALQADCISASCIAFKQPRHNPEQHACLLPRAATQHRPAGWCHCSSLCRAACKCPCIIATCSVAQHGCQRLMQRKTAEIELLTSKQALSTVRLSMSPHENWWFVKNGRSSVPLAAGHT